MIVERIMTRQIACCKPDDTLEQAARLMLDNDVGAVPVVEDGNKVVGMITDRDACLAAYAKHAPLSDIRVDECMSRHVRTIGAHDELATLEQRMRAYRVRRMPVVHDGQLVGIVSLDDLAIAADRGQGKHGFPSPSDVTHTLAAISTQTAESDQEQEEVTE